MKLMTKLLLINWHYFNYTVIEFDKINFLTGKNASGKSTIIDAMQILLLGDTSGTFFNKAASGKSNRTLKGYLMGELGDDDESGFKSLRNGRFTSYIVLEFFDNEKNRSFTAGCCFDVYSFDDIHKLFFHFDGPIPDHKFIRDKTPFEFGLLRSYLKENYPQNYSTSDTNQVFRNDLYGKLGGLQTRFGQLLKKAVSFDPTVDIQKFISEFICEAREPVNISNLQDNIHRYTSLEAEEARLREKLNQLEEINNTFDKYNMHLQNETLYSYLVDYARKDIKILEITLQKEQEKKYESEIKELETAIDVSNLNLERNRSEKDELRAQLLTNETARILEHLEGKIREKEEEIRFITNEFNDVSHLFTDIFVSWFLGAKAAETIETNVISSRVEDTSDTGKYVETSIDPMLFRLLDNIKVEATVLYGQIKNIDLSRPDYIPGIDLLNSLIEKANSLKNDSGAMLTRLAQEQEKIVLQNGEFKKELKTLEEGKYQFDQNLLDLRAAISGKLRIKAGKTIQVLIVAEAAEIPDKRWRNSIEGYMSTQKFYIIVPPEFFKDALLEYNAIKRERNIYSTGLVDIEKIEKLNPQAEPGSLAEEITAENPYVKLFLDYTLGRVMKCDHVSDLRNFRTAITDEGMLYQNYVARAISPSRWAKPAIGHGAILQRIEDVKNNIKNLEENISSLLRIQEQIKPLSRFVNCGERDVIRLVNAAGREKEIPELEKELAELGRNLASVDRSAIQVIEDRVKALEIIITQLEQELIAQRNDKSTSSERLRKIKEDTIPKLEDDLAIIELDIANKYNDKWTEETGKPRYQKELSSRGNAAAIEQAFPRELTRSTNSKKEFWEDLRELRRRYIDLYKMGYDSGALDNEVFENEWLELSDIRLPEYHEKIADAREKALEQFRQDFISRLQSNINEAQQRIKELNIALAKFSFGEDTYHFRIVANQDFKRYYDMIVDPMLLEGGYTLFSDRFNTIYKAEIGELFSLITDRESIRQGTGYGDYEKRVQTFTDYRTYLSFDLEVTNSAGESQRLSKTIGKKSGGETQTPFYIAVLASFAQLYRMGRDKKANTARIIIFDEAFSKMDSERIISSIDLLRQFDFQVVLSAPFDKIGDIGTLVDRNLCVIREPGEKQAHVVVFDPRKIGEANVG
jgi:uncharacterized protein YPO0396